MPLQVFGPGVEAAKIQTLTAIVVGDSMVGQHTGIPSGLNLAVGAYPDSRGFFHWANGFLGQRFSLVKVSGVTGNTTADLLARLATDVLAVASDWVVLMIGANDVANDVPAATTTANLTTILNALSNRRVVLTTVPPSSSYNTTARRAALTAVNKWIQALPLTRRNVVVVDAWRTVADPATGSPATGMSKDNIHPSEAGAQRIGKAIADALSSIVPPRPSRSLGLLDSDNVIGNPHMASGTGWATGGTGVTAAYTTADGRFSNKATLTLTGVTDIVERYIQYVELIGNGRYAAGDIVQMSARIKWSGATPVTSATGTFRPWLRVMPRLADSSFPGPNALALEMSSSNSVQPVGDHLASGDMVVITNRITLPTNVANLYVGAGWQGMAAGTVEISDLAIWKNA